MASAQLLSVKFLCGHNPHYKRATAMTQTQVLPPAVLLIDVGNTRLKAGWVLPATGRRETSSIALAHSNIEKLADWIRQQPVRLAAAIGVNVAGDSVALSLDTLLLHQHAIHIHWNHSQPTNANVHNGYTQPAQLGPDRWMAMIGLATQQDGSNTPMMLANFGTATTIDTLVRCNNSNHTNPQWRFVGGLILPGADLMRMSLNTGTARLPAAQGATAAFPNSTQLAISSGVAAAQAGALLRQWLAVQETHQIAPRVFSAGGAWTALENEVQALLSTMQTKLNLPTKPIQWLASPVLDGLAQLACNDQLSP
ncbi:type III pantothenate kinase [Alcaligenaceae bacterium]|nr:type III pantothenate kinase [Alcaligenaceae bacterium]